MGNAKDRIVYMLEVYDRFLLNLYEISTIDKKYPNYRVIDNVLIYFEESDPVEGIPTVRLQEIEAIMPHKGHGTVALEKINDICDSLGYGWVAEVDSYGALTNDQLLSWYKKHGARIIGISEETGNTLIFREPG